MTVLHVLHTGIANMASVRAGLTRAGAEVVITDDPDEARRATHLMLPGVGAFGSGMAALRARGLDRVLHAHFDAGRPFLAICLGLQLLCRSSEETPGVEGLSILDAHVGRFPSTVRVPQFGWNHITPTPGARLVRPGYAYFANSFRLSHIPAGWEGATGEHGAPFVAAIERGNVLACQFHPELSSEWGQALLRRWLKAPSC